MGIAKVAKTLDVPEQEAVNWDVCKDCEDRYVGCHASCDRGKHIDKKRKEAKDRRQQERDIDLYLIENIMKHKENESRQLARGRKLYSGVKD